MRRSLLLRAVTLLFAAIPVAASSQPADGEAVRLRTLFFQRDFEAGVIEGAKLVAASPVRTQLKAWYLMNLARTDRVDEAIEPARQLVAAAATDGWAWMAQAAKLHYKGGQMAEAIESAAKAFELMPASADAAWLRAQTLAADPKRRDEAIAFVDAHRVRLGNPAELLTAKAYAFYVLSSATTPRDEARLKQAFDTYAEARQADPKNVNAHFLPGTYLVGLRRADEAYALLKKAVALAPGASDVHLRYWSAVKANPNLTAEQKYAAIEADVTFFLERHGNRPGALLAASYAARDLNQADRRRQIENTILQTFGDSAEAEWVLIGRLREFNTEEGIKKPEYRQMLRDYVARPKHYDESLLGETYRKLFFNLVGDPSVRDTELLRVADGMTKYETTNIHSSYVAAAMALADRKIQLDKAEQIARDSIEMLKKGAERDRSFYKSDQEFQDQLKSAPAIGHDALGWVLLTRGRLDEAEQELLKALELSPGNRENLYHLGRFYEAKHDAARAEEYYVKGLAVQSPGTNPSEAALKAMYDTRHGSAEGYDTYLAGIRERDRVARRESILAARLASRVPVSPFNLKTLDGRPVTLDSLKAKIMVINFWGIWCGWCVKELPECQELHETYAADPDVAILTIDNDHNTSDVPPWMRQRGFTFTVLLDDGYVAKAGVQLFPTTWFLDREGRKVFEKGGWSEKLLEEFSWRVEAIRGATTLRSTAFLPF